MTMRGAGFVLVGLGFSGAMAAAAPPAPAAKPKPPKERRLHVASAEASSYLVNDWNKFQENYLPLYVGDDDPKTAWSLKTEGIGEWLRVHVTPMEGASKLRMKIRNGYQKTTRLWEANSRAKELTVTLLPSKKTVDVALEDRSDWQEIAVEQPAGALEAVELKVKSVYAGKKYDDLCISDVQLFVTATSTDNPAFEKQRLGKIATWKKERVAAAKMFKTKLGQSLPIAPQYAVSHLEAPQADAAPTCNPTNAACRMSLGLSRAARLAAKGKHAAALATARELTKTEFATMTAVRVSVRDRRPFPTVDGLCKPDLDVCSEDLCAGVAMPLPVTGQLGYLNTDALALIEQTGLPSFADAMTGKPPQCQGRKPTTFAWALRDASSAPDAGVARVRALLLVQCGMVDARDGDYLATQPQLLVYDDDGRLEIVSGLVTTAALDWEQGAEGPKLARGSVIGAEKRDDMQVDAVVAVANK